MFFYIGNECKLLEQVDAGLFLDKGWTKVNSVWYKGYSTECNLSENIDNILNGYKPKGIWCVISSVDAIHKVYHPKLCNFPSDGFTNLYNNNVVHNYLTFNNTVNSLDTVFDNIVSMLVDTIHGYTKYNSDTLNIWCTGGLDSGSYTSYVVFRNDDDVLGFVGTNDTTNVTDRLLGYNSSTGVLEFSSLIDGGTY